MEALCQMFHCRFTVKSGNYSLHTEEDGIVTSETLTAGKTYYIYKSDSESKSVINIKKVTE